jgi:hypothetical protein
VTPTRPRLLVVLAVIGAVAGWALTRLVDAYAGRSLPVPWTAPVVMALLALALVLWARGTRARLGRRPGTKPMEPLLAARTAALAMAGSRTGSVVAGFYVGVAIALSGSWDVPYVRELVLLALATVATSGAVVAASLWLERVCRIPPGAVDDETA